VGTIAAQPRRTDLSLSYGTEYERESLSDVQSGDFGPASQRVIRPSVSGFGEVQARIAQRVSLLAGSRVEKYRGLAAAHVPRAAVVVTAVRDVVDLRGGVSQAYKAPNIQEQFPNNPGIVANPDLKPETSHSWEVGTDLRAHRATATAALTYFRQDYQNLIRTVAYDATRQISRNIGRSRATGFEAEAAVYPRARWTVGGEGSWIATRIIDNNGLGSSDFPNGGTLPFRPTYTTSVYVDMPVLATLNVLTRVSGVGPQTVLANRFSGPRVGIPSYRLLGATARWQMTRAANAYVQLDNILNAGYEVAFDRPGLARAITLGVRTTLGGAQP
jgi:outer membrane receptor protein involved in Fe transport